MDFVYICRGGANEELRYSIRSLLANTQADSIWVVGGKPDWYSGNYIRVVDEQNKFFNIVKCYKAIIDNDKISNSFVLMNDDFFILKPIDKIPFYFDGTLQDKIDKHVKQYGLSKYSRVLQEAKKRLVNLGISNPLNFDVHLPIIFEKEKLKKIIDLSLAPRSLYGNLFAEKKENIKDVKIYKYDKKITLDCDFISTEDNSFNLISKDIKSNFDKPSIYEKII